MNEKNYFDEHSLTCRCKLTDSNYTKEYVFPKWLQKKFEIENSKLFLTNGTSIPYKQLTIPCCKICNGNKMSQYENIIKQGVDAGYEEFIRIDNNIIVWWLAKIYYSNLVKETQLKKDIKDPSSSPMIHQSFMNHFNNLYRLKSEFFNSPNYDNKSPYELCIFKTNENVLDELVKLLPITIEDLKGIKGFKEEHIQLFGQYLIKSIIEIKSKYLK